MVDPSSLHNSAELLFNKIRARLLTKEGYGFFDKFSPKQRSAVKIQHPHADASCTDISSTKERSRSEPPTANEYITSRKSPASAPLVNTPLASTPSTVNTSFTANIPSGTPPARRTSLRNHLVEPRQVAAAKLPTSVDAPIKDDQVAGIPYRLQGKQLLMMPSLDQWLDFPRLLSAAHQIEKGTVGAFKVLMPTGILECALPKAPTAKTSSFSRFKFDQEYEGAFTMYAQNAKEDDPSDLEVIRQSSSLEIVKHFESLALSRNGLCDARYSTDLDAKNPGERTQLGLQEKSPIWPLHGDLLPTTWESIPGVHSPYAYKAGPAFGAPFAMHKDDFNLIAVNHLYEGEKLWLLIPPRFAPIFEQSVRRMASDLADRRCDQFLRHRAMYFSTSLLEQWGIEFHIIHQLRNETVVVLSNAYHQGFSNGPTFAEAVNYAPEGWNIKGYKGCNWRCGGTAIHIDSMRSRGKLALQLPENLTGAVGSSAGNSNRTTLDGGELNAAEEISFEADAVEGTEHRSRAVAAKPQKTARSHLNEQGASTNIQSRISRKRKRAASTLNDQIKFLKSLNITQSELGPSALQSLAKNVPSLPKNHKYILRIYNIFLHAKEATNHSQLWLLTQLFFTTASSIAFAKLYELGAILQSNTIEEVRNGSKPLEILDRIDVTQASFSILQRFYLCELLENYEARVEAHQSTTPYTRLRQSLAKHVHGASQSLAYYDLIHDAYPGLTQSKNRRDSTSEWAKRHSALKSRLASARKWKVIKEELGHGILALIPVGADVGIQNYQWVFAYFKL